MSDDDIRQRAETARWHYEMLQSSHESLSARTLLIVEVNGLLIGLVAAIVPGYIQTREQYIILSFGVFFLIVAVAVALFIYFNEYDLRKRIFIANSLIGLSNKEEKELCKNIYEPAFVIQVIVLGEVPEPLERRKPLKPRLVSIVSEWLTHLRHPTWDMNLQFRQRGLKLAIVLSSIGFFLLLVDIFWFLIV